MRSRFHIFALVFPVMLGDVLVRGADPADASIDVTAKILPLVKGNTLSFPVDADNLGDPSPGDPKKLRLEFTVAGKEIVKFFAESQDVSVTAAAPITLKSAIFGVFPNPVDVTRKVEAVVREGALQIKADNDAIGIDPSPGASKALTVRYLQGSAELTQTVREGDTLIIQPRQGVSLVILEATWGEVAPFYDVTQRLVSAMKDGTLAVKVDNKLLGDPSLGNPKELRVEYVTAGTAHSISIKEGSVLKLPAPGDPKTPVVITKATYGVLAAGY